MQLQADYLLALWAKVRVDELPRSPFDAELPTIQAQCQDWLLMGSDCPSPKTVEICRNVLSVCDALWLFTHQPGVEPTNNSAQCALRHPVIWRCLTYGTHPVAAALLSPASSPSSKPAVCKNAHRSGVAKLRGIGKL
jgi:hypothetical protein